MSTIDYSGFSLLLRQTERRLAHALAPQLAELDLTAEAWRVMTVLDAEPGIGMARLADAAVLPPASLTRYVDKLVERSLVVRRLDPADKRRVLVALSPLGRLAAERIREHEAAVERSLRAEFGDERFDRLVGELNALPRD